MTGSLISWSAEETVDPRSPAIWHAQEKLLNPSNSRWPWIRIQQLEAEESILLKKISELPQHNPKFLSNHLGYHSKIQDIKSDEPRPPHQINLMLSRVNPLDSIALAPAFSPRKNGAYAFPKRFKIEVKNSRIGQFETLINWMDEDFPDPGPYPVFFSGINKLTRQVRITIPCEATNQSYFALGEIYLFRKRINGHTGVNMVPWVDTSIEVSDSFVVLPLWDKKYLSDGVNGFGFPLSDKIVEGGDLLILPQKDNPSLADSVQLTLDLGAVRTFGPIKFWSAEVPHDLALPSFGFPKEITVELSLYANFSEKQEKKYKQVPQTDIFTVRPRAYKTRYIRITLKGLRKYQDRLVLGLGEIEVSNNYTVLSTGCQITAKGIPQEYLDQLPRLVDGCSRSRRIFPQSEWIKGLAQRRPLDHRLLVVKRELEQIQISWQKTKQRIWIWGGCSLFAGLVIGMVLQRRQRKKIMNRLKWRIARDLHDEVGSSLGSISLTAELLETKISDSEIKEDLEDLSLIAREAAVSLREVVWVIDQSTIHLPDLIKKLVERARRILKNTVLSVKISPNCPNLEVSQMFKRHLIMFFKEVVHNCARHANASLAAQVIISTDKQQLRIEVTDNGVGFNPQIRSDGCGMDNMKERAQEMGGRIKIISQPNLGTSIVLSIPLDHLNKEPSNAYITSNQ